MALFNKLQNSELPAHEFSASLHMWAIGEITEQNIISFFGLETTDEDQLEQIKLAYDSKRTALSKLEYLFRIEHTFYLIQNSGITLNMAKNILEVI